MIDIVYNCTMCGAIQDRLTWGDEINSFLLSAQWCFECMHWQQNLAEDAKRPWYEALVSNGQHYRAYAGIKNEPASWLGSAGRKFLITNMWENIGQEHVVTNDLWHQGRIPAVWLDRFPENCLIQPATKEILAGFDLKTGFPLAKERL